MTKGGKELQKQIAQEINQRRKHEEEQYETNEYWKQEHINSQIIAFFRGWKVRKVMQCDQIINLLRSYTEISVNIKQSMRNPHNSSFIQDFKRHRTQLVDHFIRTFYSLYHTGAWTKSFNGKIKGSESSKKSSYNQNVFVDLSTMNSNTNQSLANSMHPQVRHFDSINSQIFRPQFESTPARNVMRGINWNSTQFQTPQQLQFSPFRVMGFNPIGGFPLQNQPRMFHNQRYAVQRGTGISISDNRPSDLEAMNLVNQVLGHTSPIHGRSPQTARPEFEMSTQKMQNYDYSERQSFTNPYASPLNPVVPEFQRHMNPIRETVEIPVNQAASINTFHAVNIEDMPAQSNLFKSKNKQLELSRISGSPEQTHQTLNQSIQMSVEIPKVDFEKMLEEALKKEDPDYQYERDDLEAEDKKVAKPKKKAKFLKRKKVYDPKEAIMKEKQVKTKGKKKNKNSKSAFPDNFFREKDPNDSEVEDEQNEDISDEDKPRKDVRKKVEKEGQKDQENKSDVEPQENENEIDDNQQSPEGEDGQQEVQKKHKKAKPFLKRKTREVKFQKLNWNKVKSRTDCWTKPSARSEHREPREKSIPAVAKFQAAKKQTQRENVPKMK